MRQQELAVEVQLALQGLFHLALKHFEEPNYEDRETLEAEERYLEAQLALQLKTRDNAFEAQMRIERGSGETPSPATEVMMRDMLDGMFLKDTNRYSSQLSDCREKLAAIRK
jgi:hypothetical protein